MSKIVFRRGVVVPTTELMDVGEPMWDVNNAKFGVNNGEQQPRWYPCIDTNNNLILNPNTGIYSSNYQKNAPKSYLTFNGSQFQLYSNGKLTASYQDTGSQLYSALVANSGVSSTGAINFPGFSIDTLGNVTINGNLIISGSMNLSLSQFAAAVLPTAFSPGNILIAGSPHTWQDPAVLFNSTTFGMTALRAGNNPEAFKMDLVNNNYFFVNRGGSTAFVSRRLNDFLSNPALSFTRPSTATYHDKHGILVKAAANVAREDYNPFTGEKMGILIEGVSTNLIYNSTDPSVWTGINTTIASSSNPDIVSRWAAKGLGDPNEILETTATGNHNVAALVPNASETLPTSFSFYVEADPAAARNTIAISVENVSGSNTFGAFFNLNPMNVGSSINTGNGNLLRTNIRQITSTIYRISITGTVNAVSGSVSATLRAKISGAQSGSFSYAGGTGGLMICSHFQLEVNDKPSSLIPTTGTVTSRNPDSLSLNLALIDFDAAVGTVKLGVRQRNYSSPGAPIFNMASTTDATSFHNLALNGSLVPELVCESQGSVLYDLVLNALTPYVQSNIIYNYTSYGKVAINQDGNAVSTATNSGNQAITINVLNIGTNAYNTQYLEGWINFISYSTKVLTQ